MVKRCCWGTCNTDSRYPDRLQGGIVFIPFPKPGRNLEKAKRWIRMCGRPHYQLNEDILKERGKAKHLYVCSKHFVNGQPSEMHPDPVSAVRYDALTPARKRPTKRGSSSETRTTSKRQILMDTSTDMNQHNEAGSDVLKASSEIQHVSTTATTSSQASATENVNPILPGDAAGAWKRMVGRFYWLNDSEIAKHLIEVHDQWCGDQCPLEKSCIERGSCGQPDVIPTTQYKPQNHIISLQLEVDEGVESVNDDSSDNNDLDLANIEEHCIKQDQGSTHCTPQITESTPQTSESTPLRINYLLSIPANKWTNLGGDTITQAIPVVIQEPIDSGEYKNSVLQSVETSHHHTQLTSSGATSHPVMTDTIVVKREPTDSDEYENSVIQSVETSHHHTQFTSSGAMSHPVMSETNVGVVKQEPTDRGEYENSVIQSVKTSHHHTQLTSSGATSHPVMTDTIVVKQEPTDSGEYENSVGQDMETTETNTVHHSPPISSSHSVSANTITTAVRAALRQKISSTDPGTTALDSVEMSEPHIVSSVTSSLSEAQASQTPTHTSTVSGNTLVQCVSVGGSGASNPHYTVTLSPSLPSAFSVDPSVSIAAKHSPDSDQGRSVAEPHVLVSSLSSVKLMSGGLLTEMMSNIGADGKQKNEENTQRDRRSEKKQSKSQGVEEKSNTVFVKRKRLEEEGPITNKRFATVTEEETKKLTEDQSNDLIDSKKEDCYDEEDKESDDLPVLMKTVKTNIQLEDSDTDGEIQERKTKDNTTADYVNKVSVAPALNLPKRVYDKRHCCYYCGGMYGKISIHLQVVHPQERLVADVLEKNKGERERKEKWKKIRNMGNFLHNIKTLNGKDGHLIVERRPRVIKGSEKFLPCTYCLGFFDKGELWRHTKACPLLGQMGNKKRHLYSAQLLLDSNLDENLDMNDRIREVLAGMQSDEVFKAIQTDKSLLVLGSITIKKLGRCKMANVIQTLKEMGKLLIFLRKDSKPSACFNDFLKPKEFNTVVKAIHALNMCSNSDSLIDGLCPKHHLRLYIHVDQALKQLAEIKRGIALREGNEENKRDAEDYLLLHKSVWEGKIKSHAKHVQWSIVNPDTLVPSKIDLINEVSG